MPRNAEKKIRLLVLYDILHKETDTEHQLSTNELIDKLASYGMRIDGVSDFANSMSTIRLL